MSWTATTWPASVNKGYPLRVRVRVRVRVRMRVRAGAQAVVQLACYE